MLHNFLFSINWLKKIIFLFLTPQHPLPQIEALLNFEPKKLKTPKGTSKLLLNIRNKLKIFSSIWRRVMPGTNSKNEQNEKIGQKITSLGLRGVEMGLKSRERQKAHSRHLLNIHTLFQLPSPIWRGDRGRTALF